MGCGGGAW